MIAFFIRMFTVERPDNHMLIECARVCVVSKYFLVDK